MSSAGYRIIVALLALAATGCAGNGSGLDANGNPVTPGGGSGTPLTADFKSIQDNVFTPICTKCHIGAGAPQGLQLDAANSYAMLVGVPSAEQPAVLRVAAGDPANSYIIRKLQATGGISGGQMPLGGPYLPQSTIDVIAQWITAGAPKPAAAMSLGASVKAVQHFNVATTSPDNGSIVSMAVPQIVVAFNGDIDSTLLNSTTVTLVRTDAAQSMQALQSMQAIAPVTPVTTTVPAGNPSAILITPRTPLTNGTYRVTLPGSLANMNAQALGTDYSFTFTVDVLK
jgi:methionine-rich copper-binding protein CopC